MRSVSSLSVLLLGSAVTAAAFTFVSMTGCSELKDADLAAAKPGGPSGGDDEGGGADVSVADASAIDADRLTPEGGPVSGDPRLPLWPTPADQPALTDYAITNGTDGATVTDKVTGLVWQDATSGATYDFAGAGAYCDGLVYDGAADWRAPTRIEAISIMSFGFVGANAMTGPAFTAVTASCTWTASLVNTSGNAFDVQADGVDSAAKATKCAVRCVRNGAPLGATTKRPYEIDVSTVRDPVTGLVWERTPPENNGGSLKTAAARCGARVVGTPPRSMRVPTVKELAGIVDETRGAPASAAAFGTTTGAVRTSIERWIFNFYDGTAMSTASGPFGSRCVVGP